MKILFNAGVLLAVALIAPSSLKAQNTIFSDNFSSSKWHGVAVKRAPKPVCVNTN